MAICGSLFGGSQLLYTYIVALAGLGALATGAAGLIWTLFDLALVGPSQDVWKEHVALFATLAVVGLPVWLLHWRVVRADSARAAPAVQHEAATEVTVRIRAADAAAIDRALEALRATGVTVSVG